MTAPHASRRVLIAARAAERAALHVPFTHPDLRDWEPLDADSLDRVHFLLQHDTCDVVLLDDSLLPTDAKELAWLAEQRTAPLLLLLTTPSAETLTTILATEVQQWLPRELALANPSLLAAALRHTLRWAHLWRRLDVLGESLHDCRRRVSRLVDMVWESAPVESRSRWFTQRYMLERLQEEVTRTARYGTPFSVVIGEVRADPAQTAPEDTSNLTSWAAERITRAKRRSDVVGHYGPHGFMLLLANTPESGAATFCRRLEAALEQDAATGPQPLHPVFGIAGCRDVGVTPQSLLRRAEEQLEQARTEDESRTSPPPD